MSEGSKRADAHKKGNEDDHGSVVVRVNKSDVTMNRHRVTGLDIKQSAVEQSVPNVTVEFLLMLIDKKNGVRSIGNEETLAVTKHSEFKMLSPDDNSEY